MVDFFGVCAAISVVLYSSTMAQDLTCQSPELKHLPFCNRDLSFEHRADDLLARMNVTEKISQMGTHGCVKQFCIDRLEH